LEKFFDRVNHDLLMGLVAKRVSDKRILRLIRGLLTAGVLADGLVSGRPTRGRRRAVLFRRCCRT
jgi:RNA-directed DNA polymerase